MNIDSLTSYIERELKTKKVENIQVKDKIDTDLGTIQSFSFTYNKNKKGYLVQGTFVNVYETDYEEMTSDNALLYFVGRKCISPFLQIENQYPLYVVKDNNLIESLELEFKDHLVEVCDEFKFLGGEDLSEIKIYNVEEDNKDYWSIFDKHGVCMYVPKINFVLTDSDYLAMHYGVELRMVNEEIRTQSEEESKKRA